MKLEQLIKLADEATPGPWKKVKTGEVLAPHKSGGFSSLLRCMDADCGEGAEANGNEADTDFIAAANPATVKQLCQDNLDLTAKLAIAEEDAKYGWMNVKSSEKACMEKMAKRDALQQALTNEQVHHTTWVIASQAREQQLRKALEEINKAAKYNQSTWGKWIKDMCEKFLALTNDTSALDALVKDAERYRHLRKNATPQWHNGPGLYWYLPLFMQEETPREKLDEAIDAAMTEVKK